MKNSDKDRILGLFKPSTSLFSLKKLILPILLIALIILATVLSITAKEPVLTDTTEFVAEISSDSFSLKDSPTSITNTDQKPDTEPDSQTITGKTASSDTNRHSSSTVKEANKNAKFSSVKPRFIGTLETKLALLVTGYSITADSLDQQLVNGLGFTGTITKDKVTIKITDFAVAEKPVNNFIGRYTGKEYSIGNSTTSVTITSNGSEYSIIEE